MTVGQKEGPFKCVTIRRKIAVAASDVRVSKKAFLPRDIARKKKKKKKKAGLLYNPCGKVEAFTKPNLTSLPPFGAVALQKPDLPSLCKGCVGQIQVKRHSFLDMFTKILALAWLRCWKEDVVPTPFAGVYGSSSVLCICRTQSRIQKETRFGIIF